MITRRRLNIVAAIVCGAAAGCLPILIIVVLFLFGDEIDDWRHRRAFDSHAWKHQTRAEEASMGPPRLCMADSLVGSGRLDGMTKGQVIDLLGPPSSEVTDDTYFFDYYLGPERGFIRIDSETLVIEFRDDGKVRRYWIYRD